jgi:hypothetical protein
VQKGDRMRIVFGEQQYGGGTMMKYVPEEQRLCCFVSRTGNRQSFLCDEKIDELPVGVPSDEEGGFHWKKPAV